MSGLAAKPPGRSRPTNNQLLYKANFRWRHYTSPLPHDIELSEGTEACASVTSAFLQVLATIQAVEAARLDRPRNILRILATNTRRTKVVELGSGTHRVADELRRHSLPDGEGAQYSTNLDRNRYGSDNNYLFTVTRYNLECLGLCPCLVDIEIVDTRNGNEVQLVSAGEEACSCHSPERRERADASHQADAAHPVRSSGAHSPSLPDQWRAAPARTQDALPSVFGAPAGMRRAPSAGALRRASSAARLMDHSRVNSGGSELFDALLAAANDEPRSQRPAASSGHEVRAASSGLAPLPPRARMPWNASFNEVDSLQNAIDAFRGEDEVGMNRLGSRSSRRMLRRNSVSMIIENPVLAQTGAGGDSLMLGPALGGQGVSDADLVGRAGRQEGTDEAEGYEHASFRSGLLRTWQRSASGLNLPRMGSSAGLAQFGSAAPPAEVRQLREEVTRLEGRLEESRARERAATDLAAGLGAELRETRAAARKAALVLRRVRDRSRAAAAAAAAAAVAGHSSTAAAAAVAAAAAAATVGSSAPTTSGSGEDGTETGVALEVELAKAAAGLLTEEELASVASTFLTSEAEIEMVRGQLTEARAELARLRAKRPEGDDRNRGASASPAHTLGLVKREAALPGSPAAGRLPAASPPLPPLLGSALGSLGGAHASAFRPHHSAARGLSKVASMPNFKRAHFGDPRPMPSQLDLRGSGLAAPEPLSLIGRFDDRLKRPRSPVLEGTEDSQTVQKRHTSLGAETVELAAPAASAVHDVRAPDVGEAESKPASKGIAVGSRSEGADSPAPSPQPPRDSDGGKGGSEAQATPAAVAAAV